MGAVVKQWRLSWSNDLMGLSWGTGGCREAIGALVEHWGCRGALGAVVELLVLVLSWSIGAVVGHWGLSWSNGCCLWSLGLS